MMTIFASAILDPCCRLLENGLTVALLKLTHICCFVRSVSKECNPKGVFNDKSG
jgi:hypothetical protein